MLLTRRSLKDSCSAVLKLHVAGTMQNIAFAFFTLHLAHNLSSSVYTIFRLYVAHTLQNPVFAVLFIARSLHVTESCFY